MPVDIKLLLLGILGYACLLLVSSSSPRVQVHNYTPEKQKNAINTEDLNRRKLLSTHSNEADLGFRAELVRHVSRTNITRTERLYEAVKRSKARAKALLDEINNKRSRNRGSMSSHKKDFQTPVASISGAYTMQLLLGTPPQKFNAIVDTGSDLVWIQCKPCSQCYSQNDPIFDPSSSSSFKKTSCTTASCQSLPTSACSRRSQTCLYGYQYGDSSSTQGDFALETLTMKKTSGGSQTFSNFQFGCGRLNSGSFGGAAGIVGLGQGSISLSTQLGSAISNKFSYCLVNFDDDSSKTSPMLFGSSAGSSAGAEVSTPIIPSSQSSTYYYVGLESVSVGGKTLSLSKKQIEFTTMGSNRIRTRALEVNSGGTIFDSGTTLTLFSDNVYSKVKSAFSSSINLPTVDGSSAGFDLCYDVSKSKSYKFPSLTLGFKGSKFTPPQSNYFVLVDTAGTVACLAMGGSGSLGLGIIGNLMQQNYHVLYDRSAGIIALSPAKCDSL